MALLAVASYFESANQDNRAATVGFFVGMAIVFAALAFIATFFNRQPPVSTNLQPKLNKNVRIMAFMIILPVVTFIIILYLLAWWLGKGLTF